MTKTEREEFMPLKMFVDGIKIAQKKADGKPHTVRVYKKARGNPILYGWDESEQ